MGIILVPNLGDSRFRIPLTNFRIPVLIGGTRFEATRDPRLPNWMAIATLLAAIAASVLAILDPSDWSGKVGGSLEANNFSILLTTIFLIVLFLCTIAASQSLPSNHEAGPPEDGDDEETEASKTAALYDNRRQADRILLLTMGLEMSPTAKSTHLFALRSSSSPLSSYALVGFNKRQRKEGRLPRSTSSSDL